jgi:hypothetical protein
MIAGSLNQGGKFHVDLIRRMITRPLWPGYFALVAALLLGFLFAWLPLKLAAALVVGVAVILFILVQPLFGLALALVTSPLGALEQLLSGFVSLDSGQVLLLITLISWFGRGLARRCLEIPRTFLNLPLFLFIFVGFISLLDAISVLTGLKELLKWLEIVVIMLLVMDLGREGAGQVKGGLNRSLLGGPPRTIWIVGMLFLAGISQSLIGIWQFRLRDDGPEHFLVLERYYRAYGTFEQPNPFGGFMNLTVLLALGVLAGLIAAWWLWLRRRSTAEAKSNAFSPGWCELLLTVVIAVIAGLTGAALLFSWSRGAWLAFGVGVAAMVLFWPRKRIYGVLILGFVVILALIATDTGLMPESVTARLTGFAEDFTVGDV